MQTTHQILSQSYTTLLKLAEFGKASIVTFSKISSVSYAIFKKIGSVCYLSPHIYTVLNVSKDIVVSALNVVPISLDIFKKILILYPIKFYYSKIFFVAQKFASDCFTTYELTQKIISLTAPFSNEKIDGYALKKSIRTAIQAIHPEPLQNEIAKRTLWIFELVMAQENKSLNQANEFIHTDKTIHNIVSIICTNNEKSVQNPQSLLDVRSTSALQTEAFPLNHDECIAKAIDEERFKGDASVMQSKLDSQNELLVHNILQKIQAQEIRHTRFQTLALICSTLSTATQIPKVLKHLKILDLGKCALSSGKISLLSHITHSLVPVFKVIEILGLLISTLDNAYLTTKYLQSLSIAKNSEERSESLHYFAKAFTEFLQYGLLLAYTSAICILGATYPPVIILAIISKSVDLIILLTKHKLPQLPPLTNILIP